MKTLVLSLMLVMVGCGRPGDESTNPMAQPENRFQVNDDLLIFKGLHQGCTARVLDVLDNDLYTVETECSSTNVVKSGKDMTYLDPVLHENVKH